MPVDFSPYHAILLDLDGTLYHDDQPLPGAVDLLRRLQSEQRAFACISNSGAGPVTIVERLYQAGIEVDPDHIYTAAAAVCDYVMHHFAKDADAAPRRPRVFNLATDSVAGMLEGLVDWIETPDQLCDAILCASPSSTFATEPRQRTALELARRGAKVLGLCADRIFPSHRGLEFGSGALSWMLAYAACVEPVFCGKPERIFFDVLCERLGVAPEWCLLVGDNLESDIFGGKQMGMRTILTLSGVTRRADVEQLPADQQPDMIIDDLRDLL